SMSIDFDTENDRAKYQRSIQTSISRVSAATFDSDGLPNANDTFDLGNATYRWKDLYLSGNAYIGTATEDEHAVRKDQTTISRNADITVTVGSSGDYSSINDALEYLTETYNPTFINEGFTAEIELMSGFEMQEQILVKGLDLSWITITSIDDEVSVDRSSLDTLFLDNYPVFGVDNGSLPVVDVLFSMDSSGDGSGRSGFKGNNCNITILDGGGMENAGGVGLYVISCKVFANGSIFNNSNSIGVYTENSVVNFEGAQINGSVGDGMRLQYGSVGNLYQIEINNSSQRGLKVVSATAFANGSTITNSGSDNVYASAAATGSFDSSTLTGAGAYGIASYRASNISGHNSNTTGAVSGGFRVRYGGVIDATGSGVQGSLSQSANSLTADGIIFQ
ncbi:MAG: right-handed parallel beta-helix repeat-containing protein, partial [Candidatus Paceibacterota bacterium]